MSVERAREALGRTEEVDGMVAGGPRAWMEAEQKGGPSLHPGRYTGSDRRGWLSWPALETPRLNTLAHVFLSSSLRQEARLPAVGCRPHRSQRRSTTLASGFLLFPERFESGLEFLSGKASWNIKAPPEREARWRLIGRVWSGQAATGRGALALERLSRAEDGRIASAPPWEVGLGV
jgi:hypothetical protein